MWINSGTASVTNGQRVVNFVDVHLIASSVQPGFGFQVEGKLYEIETVDSATKITLKRAWMGATGAGLQYDIVPTRSLANDLATAISALRDQYQNYLSTSLNGAFAAGSNAAPGVRFVGDLDTGFTTPASNTIGFVTAGIERARLNAEGFTVNAAPVIANGANQLTARLRATNSTAGKSYDIVAGVTNVAETGFSIFDVAAGQTRFMITEGGLVGVGTHAPEARWDVRGNALISTGAISVLGFGRPEGLSGAPTPNARGGNAFIVAGNLDNGGNGAPSYLGFHTAIGGVVVERLRIQPNGNVGIGTGDPQATLHASSTKSQLFINHQNLGNNYYDGASHFFRGAADAGAPEYMRIDTTGKLLVGVQSASSHSVARQVSEGSPVLSINSVTNDCALFGAVTGGGYSTASAALYLAKNSTTNRSINAGGTVNASGADYAEYMTKAEGCGTIAKGEVCGVDANGLLTRKWADAVSFVVKSTDPSYVGGDGWAAECGPRPEPEEEGYEAWLDAYEAARARVDRIAFAGQVPCLLTDEFEVGDYIVAAANGSGIKAVAIGEDAMTLPMYMKRIGKVWKVIDETTAWIDVQHG